MRSKNKKKRRRKPREGQTGGDEGVGKALVLKGCWMLSKTDVAGGGPCIRGKSTRGGLLQKKFRGSEV